ncbi:unnamed protein product [Larinioides sclopetarius]|uniref:Uncharacterized protein n=1 Tax=Larinioides sclopetarius TaxID=280406 RepID=A0AAV2AFX5_9ARAC
MLRRAYAQSSGTLGVMGTRTISKAPTCA